MQVGTSQSLAWVDAGTGLSWAEPSSLESAEASLLAGVSSHCERHLSRAQVKNGCNGSLVSGISALNSLFHICIQSVQLWDCQPDRISLSVYDDLCHVSFSVQPFQLSLTMILESKCFLQDR